MWKDFIHFSQGEKRGMLVLTVLIAITIVVNLLLPLWLRNSPIDFSEFKAQVDAYYTQQKLAATQRNQPQPIPFLVDTVSAAWLTEHGLPYPVAKNLTAYRDANGRLESKEDVRKIYGMTDSILDAWQPYLLFTTKPSVQPPEREIVELRKSTRSAKKEPAFQVDINAADTAIFQVLYGIGPGFANRIVNYRNLLGGFTRTDQILEVYGMDSARFLTIEPYLKLDSIALRKLPVNMASVKSLKRHPYLNFYQARDIYEFRKNRQWIENWTMLLNIEGLDTTNLAKLKPYVSFEVPGK